MAHVIQTYRHPDRICVDLEHDGRHYIVTIVDRPAEPGRYPHISILAERCTHRAGLHTAKISPSGPTADALLAECLRYMVSDHCRALANTGDPT